MTPLQASFARLNQKTKALAADPTLRKMGQVTQLDNGKVQGAMVASAQALQSAVGLMLMRSFFAAGLKAHSGTMLRALANPLVTVTPAKMKVGLAPGLTYPHGDVYAAVGSLKYGSKTQQGRSDLFTLTPFQLEELNKRWAEGVAERLQKYGLAVKVA